MCAGSIRPYLSDPWSDLRMFAPDCHCPLGELQPPLTASCAPHNQWTTPEAILPDIPAAVNPDRADF
jgi:hypothetical protein